MDSSDSQSKTSNSRTFKFRESVITDVGCKRSENQDAYSVAHTSNISLYIVADGMGGARGGATASALAVNIISGEAFSSEGELNVTTLKTAIEQSNRVINAKSVEDKDLSGMGTTVIALAFKERRAIVAHVGDSRIYRVRKGEISQLTRDHTLVQELVDSGAISESDAASHPIAHMLTRSLGPLSKVEVEIRELDEEVEAGDQFLLCSDGLYNLVSAEEICEHLCEFDPKEACHKLLELALDRGGNDNVTIEVVEVRSTEDSSFSVEYPTDFNVDVTLSGETEIGDVDSLLEKLDQHEAEIQASEQEARELREAGLDTNDLDELFIKEPFPSELQDEQFPYDEFDAELRNVRIGLTLMVGIVLATIAYSYNQYRSIVGVRVSAANVARIEEQAIISDAVAGTKFEKEEPPSPSDLRAALLQELQDAGPDKDGELVGPENTASSEARSVSESSAVSEASASSESSSISETSAGAESSASSVAQSQAEEAEVKPTVKETEVAIATAEEIEAENLLLARAVRAFASTEISEAPKVSITNEKPAGPPADQPIVWENEQRKLEKIKSQPTKTQTATAEATPTAAVKSTPTSLAEELKVVDEKIALRERIRDLDAKLLSLDLETAGDIQGRRAELKKQLADLKQAIVILRSRLESLGSKIVELEKVGVNNNLSDQDLIKTNADVRAAKERLNFAKEAYDIAREGWRKNPRDLALASSMSARSRDLEALKQEFSAIVSTAKNSDLMAAKSEWSNDRIMLEDAERGEALLNRHLGYLEAHTPLESGRRISLRDEFLRERDALVQQLDSLKTQVQDGRESAVRARAFQREL